MKILVRGDLHLDLVSDFVPSPFWPALEDVVPPATERLEKEASGESTGAGTLDDLSEATGPISDPFNGFRICPKADEPASPDVASPA